jgi:tRNA-dihydrouridine synthase 4
MSSHRHLAYMLESHFQRGERIWFNQLGSSVGAVEHLASRGLDFVATRGTIWDARRGRTLV